VTTQPAPVTVKDILRTEVVPALGCNLGGSERAKNGGAVAIPGTERLNSLDLAAAIGAFGGARLRRGGFTFLTRSLTQK